MSTYEPKYVTQKDLEAETQMEITSATDPSIEEVNGWIQELEVEIDAKKLGWDDDGVEGDGYVATNVYLDIPAVVPPLSPLRRFELLSIYGTDPYIMAKGASVKVPQKYRPIISMTSLSKTSSELDELPVWTALTEGWKTGWTEASGADYLLVMEEGKAGQQHGIAWHFFSSSRPDSGRRRLKATFKYGWNLPAGILRRYCVVRLAPAVLSKAIEAGEPTRLASYTGGDFQEYVNTQLESLFVEWEKEAKRIEKKFLPTKRSVGVLRI